MYSSAGLPHRVIMRFAFLTPLYDRRNSENAADCTLYYMFVLLHIIAHIYAQEFSLRTCSKTVSLCVLSSVCVLFLWFVVVVLGLMQDCTCLLDLLTMLNRPVL